MDAEILQKLRDANIPMDGDKIKFDELFDKIEKEKTEFMNKKQQLILENKKIEESSVNLKMDK
jgi:hypothetical protein